MAIHEACHALVAYRTRRRMEIDIATIEKGERLPRHGRAASRRRTSSPGGAANTRPTSSVSLASLAGSGCSGDDSSSGVSGDLESATTVASFMEGFWGMGSTVSSYSTAKRLEVGSRAGARRPEQEGPGP